jgi:hypothetical protein
MSGKGSNPRPVNKKVYDTNYENIFGKKTKIKTKPKKPAEWDAEDVATAEARENEPSTIWITQDNDQTER